MVEQCVDQVSYLQGNKAVCSLVPEPSLLTASEGPHLHWLLDEAGTIPSSYLFPPLILLPHLLPTHLFLLLQQHPLQQGERAVSGVQTLSKHASWFQTTWPPLAWPLLAQQTQKCS